jgi:hypothetical protein
MHGISTSSFACREALLIESSSCLPLCGLHLACNLVRLQMHSVLLVGLALRRMFIWYSLVAASAAGGVRVCD